MDRLKHEEVADQVDEAVALDSADDPVGEQQVGPVIIACAGQEVAADLVGGDRQQQRWEAVT